MSLPKNTSDVLASRGYEPLEDFACFEGRNGIVLSWSHKDAEPSEQQINDWAKEYNTAYPVDQLRAEKLKKLHAWWDNHPGIEVLPDVVLPIQEIGRNTNTAAFTLAMQINSVLLTPRDIKLVSVDDYTVLIPHLKAQQCLATFEAAYYKISEHWDATHKALMAAKTLAELEAIAVEPRS